MRVCFLMPLVASLLLPAPATAQQQGPAKSFEVASGLVAKSLRAGMVREWALREIRSAFWGNYDLKVQVAGSSALDGKARLLRVTNGAFTEELDTEGVGEGASSNRGKNRVALGSAEEAFQKGVPFFITDVAFETPVLLRYTVLSNAQLPVKSAVAMFASHGERSYFMVVETPKPFSSKDKPQQRTWKLNTPLDGKDHSYLSVVTLLQNNNVCLASNEVHLELLAGVGKPK